MSPLLTLVRPDQATTTTVGNDGLSIDERADLAAKYRAGAGSPKLHSIEREAIRAWRLARGAR